MPRYCQTLHRDDGGVGFAGIGFLFYRQKLARNAAWRSTPATLNAAAFGRSFCWKIFGIPHCAVNKITWAQAGLLTEPGRYMFKFGWLTITAADIAV
jgi:hypothetical protein